MEDSWHKSSGQWIRKRLSFGCLMENGMKMHPFIMNFKVLLLLAINTSCFAQDTIPHYGHHYLVEKEIKSCYGAKDQLNCIDSLIRIALAPPDDSGKTDRRKVYLNRFRKLGIYHFYAGHVSGQRGKLVQCFGYFDKAELYLDSLKQNGKIDEFKDIAYSIRNQKIEYCTQIYFKDSALFRQCNCAPLFTELAEQDSKSDSIIPKVTEEESPVRKNELWGEFYRQDTLRINTRFVSDNASIIYFKKVLMPIIQAKLLQNPVYLEMLGEQSMQIKRDTLIYCLSSTFAKGKYERNCRLVFSSSKQPEKFDYFTLQLSNLEFPGLIKNLEIYIPIVLTTENSTTFNEVTVYDDHFLMEIRKIPQLDPKY